MWPRFSPPLTNDSLRLGTHEQLNCWDRQLMSKYHRKTTRRRTFVKMGNVWPGNFLKNPYIVLVYVSEIYYTINGINPKQCIRSLNRKLHQAKKEKEIHLWCVDLWWSFMRNDRKTLYLWRQKGSLYWQWSSILTYNYTYQVGCL